MVLQKFNAPHADSEPETKSFPTYCLSETSVYVYVSDLTFHQDPEYQLLLVMGENITANFISTNLKVEDKRIAKIMTKISMQSNSSFANIFSFVLHWTWSSSETILNHKWRNTLLRDSVECQHQINNCYNVVIDYFTDCKFLFNLRKLVQFYQSTGKEWNYSIA